jgi:hypothetical protein
MRTTAIVGDTVRIINMEGEPQYTGKIGTVELIDDIGQIHGSWGGCAIQPERDSYEILRHA